MSETSPDLLALTTSRLRALQAVAADLAHSVDVEQAAAIVLESVRTTLGAEAGSLNLFDESATKARQVATLGLERSSVSTWTEWQVRDSQLAQELLRTGLPVLITDSESRRERFHELDHAGIEQEAWATLLLSSAGDPLGMVSFGWRDPRGFDVEDIALLQSLADHLAAAIDRAHLLHANAALLEERTRIAATLQRSLLPAPLPSWPGVTLAAAYEPAELGTEVCGDFYDAFLDHDDSLIIVIGDVAGRGVAAAGLTGMARHTLRALAREMSPPEALHRLNDVLVDAAGPGELRLLTAGVVCLRRTEGRIAADISLAGHCLPVLLRDGRAETVGSPGTMLGAVPGVDIGTTTVELEKDDVLLLHTDGVIEARRNGAEFGEARLLRLLSALNDPHPDETVEHVLNAVRWYRTTVPDDIAVVAVRVDDTP
jgi:serine phosphatase RsbU (regulator of sigma subunit)